MTLKEQIAADAVAVFSNTDEFAELITYKPKDGPSRTITGTFEEDGTLEDRSDDMTTVEVGWLSVNRDDTESIAGGIARPQIGDTIKRDPTVDPDGRLFSFTGNRQNESPTRWDLEFSRTVEFRQGTVNKRDR